ncbi:MAG: putative ABC transporter permease [Oscillospiraceae bacterium]|nr:putative ABC transporter permease [Oscillospiraceae bacterium]
MLFLEPAIASQPLSLVFLYFVWYSLLGWMMETTYCSVRQGHFVDRGFLHGPVCPIYGVGALLMVFLLGGFTEQIPFFLFLSTVTMSLWEYLVGWFLETTTHIKYWDYSNYRFNIKGRVCLKNSIYWGLVSYICIFFIHPATVRMFAPLRESLRWWLSGGLALVMLGDTALTIRSLALTSSFLAKAEAARLRLEHRRQELLLARQQKLEEAAVKASLLRLELEHNDFLAEAAHYSERFRRHYQLNSKQFHMALLSVHKKGEQLRHHRANRLARFRRLGK